MEPARVMVDRLSTQKKIFLNILSNAVNLRWRAAKLPLRTTSNGAGKAGNGLGLAIAFKLCPGKTFGEFSTQWQRFGR